MENLTPEAIEKAQPVIARAARKAVSSYRQFHLQEDIEGAVWLALCSLEESTLSTALASEGLLYTIASRRAIDALDDYLLQSTSSVRKRGLLAIEVPLENSDEETNTALEASLATSTSCHEDETLSEMVLHALLHARLTDSEMQEIESLMSDERVSERADAIGATRVTLYKRRSAALDKLAACITTTEASSYCEICVAEGYCKPL